MTPVLNSDQLVDEAAARKGAAGGHQGGFGWRGGNGLVLSRAVLKLVDDGLRRLLVAFERDDGGRRTRRLGAEKGAYCGTGDGIDHHELPFFVGLSALESVWAQALIDSTLSRLWLIKRKPSNREIFSK